MTARRYEDIEFGEDLPVTRPDVSLKNITRFCKSTGMMAGRFTDHEAAKQEGLPQAIVPGIMSQGMLVAVIHAWAPGCDVRSIDTVFRAPVLVDSNPACTGVVTDKDDDARSVEVDVTIVNEAGETRVVGTAIVGL